MAQTYFKKDNNPSPKRPSTQVTGEGLINILQEVNKRHTARYALILVLPDGISKISQPIIDKEI
jgi:hypothetical protein